MFNVSDIFRQAENFILEYEEIRSVSGLWLMPVYENESLIGDIEKKTQVYFSRFSEME